MLKRVLIIDDEKDFCELLKANLESISKFKIDIATDSRRGLYLAKKLHPAAILLDINMPIMDGFEVLRKLRNDPETIETPIIMLTAYDDEEMKTRATQLYDDLYVTKPIAAEELLVRINEVLQRRGIVWRE